MGEVQAGCREELLPLTAWGQTGSDTLLREAVQASSLEVYKTWLVEALSSLVWPQDWPLYEQNVGPDSSLGTFLDCTVLWSFFEIYGYENYIFSHHIESPGATGVFEKLQ